jgi:hypothetical protein
VRYNTIPSNPYFMGLIHPLFYTTTLIIFHPLKLKQTRADTHIHTHKTSNPSISHTRSISCRVIQHFMSVQPYPPHFNQPTRLNQPNNITTHPTPTTIHCTYPSLIHPPQCNSSLHHPKLPYSPTTHQFEPPSPLLSQQTYSLLQPNSSMPSGPPPTQSNLPKYTCHSTHTEKCNPT